MFSIILLTKLVNVLYPDIHYILQNFDMYRCAFLSCVVLCRVVSYRIVSYCPVLNRKELFAVLYFKNLLHQITR